MVVALFKVGDYGIAFFFGEGFEYGAQGIVRVAGCSRVDGAADERESAQGSQLGVVVAGPEEEQLHVATPLEGSYGDGNNVPTLYGHVFRGRYYCDVHASSNNDSMLFSYIS